jgi:hypothetical protein
MLRSTGHGERNRWGVGVLGCGGEDREIVEHPTRPPEAIKIILHGTAIRAKPFFFPQKTVHFPLDQTFISQLTHSFPRAVP